MPLVQVNQTLLFDKPFQLAPDGDLLINEVDTQLLFVLRKSFFEERLDADVGVLQGLERGYTVGTARFTLDLTDNLRSRFGYILIAGSRRTMIGQFHDNDQGFVQLRYSY